MCEKTGGRVVDVVDFKEIPGWWPVCGNGDCPMAGGCLRHAAWQNVPPTVTKWPCVLPTALKDGKCNYFAPKEKVRMARGFENMFARVRSRDARAEMRLAITNYLGSKGTYYRYKHGERQLNPERQQWILQLFSRYGYDSEELLFDEYVVSYDFNNGYEE